MRKSEFFRQSIEGRTNAQWITKMQSQYLKTTQKEVLFKYNAAVLVLRTMFLLSPLQTKSLFSDAVKMKMPIKILFIGLIGCLYVKYRYRLSCQRENTKTIPI